MKIKWYILLCMVLVLFSACSPKLPVKNEKFSIYEENGKYYMEFYTDIQDNQNQESEIGGMLVARFPSYGTVSEMQEGILAGNFSDREIEALREGQDKIEICDPNNLCDLLLPNDLKYDIINWKGDCYYFFLYARESKMPHGQIACVDKDLFNTMYDKYYSDFVHKNAQVISDQTVEDRNARVVHYIAKPGEFMEKFYAVTTQNGGTLYIKEVYVLGWFETYGGGVSYVPSTTVPACVYICGTDSNQYYYGFLSDFEERPSVEWLAAFGLEPLSD